MENFDPERMLSARLVPDKMFESYTPTELSLKRLTLDDPMWMSKICQAVYVKTKQPLQASQVEIYFRQFINENFPLAKADPVMLEMYVMKKETVATLEGATEDYRLWHSSHPYGQKYYMYPTMDHRDEPVTYEMSRFR